MQNKVMTIPNHIGFKRAYAIFRDEAKKKSFYGKNEIETLPSNIIYHLTEGIINTRISDDNIEILAQPKAEFFNTFDQAIDSIVKPFHELAGNRYQKQPYRIFGTGLSRTGTTSLYRALQMLGIFSIHHAPYLFPDIVEDASALGGISEYDAFIDTPFSYCYKELDKAYPGGKFIHTIRDPEGWVESFRWLMGNSSTPMSRWFYGIEKFDKQAYMERFSQHEEEVLNYFAGRPDDFLTMNISQADGWDCLCQFLGKPVLDIDYPCANRRQLNESSLSQRNERLT